MCGIYRYHIFDSTMETTTRKSVQAQYLKEGDVLASGEVVTTAPYIDSKIQTKQTYIGINGFPRIWNKRTEITIIIK